MKALLLLLIIGIAIGYFIYKRKIQTNKSLKEIVKSTFPKYTIIEKFNTVMICEINHRNEPDELIFIRTGEPKRIKKEGRRITVTYPQKPTINQLKKDLGKYLS